MKLVQGMPSSRSTARLALWAIAALMLIGLSPSAAQAQGSGPLGGACRDDYRRFCSGTRPGGGAIADCFRQHATELSQTCRTAIGERMASRGTGPGSAVPAASDTRVLRDIAYGPDPKQRFDVYLPPMARDAPIIVMVHGGAWAFGDKASAAVTVAKTSYWLPKGYIFVSVNTRLLPQAAPAEQAGDVARALAAVQSRASSWGGNGGKTVLMGHSAGAHLVSLLAAAPEIALKAGAAPARATVALDSAALDVPTVMSRGHAEFYDRAFGSDPAAWRSVSPLHRLARGMRPILLVCSSRRLGPCQQAETFAAAVQNSGGQAKVLPVALSHRDINASLGEPGPYTEAVDAFIGKAGTR